VGNYCYVPVCWRREALRRPQREERGGAYRGGRPPTACIGFKDDVGDGENWRPAKLQSIVSTNKHRAFYRPDVLPVAQPTV